MTDRQETLPSSEHLAGQAFAVSTGYIPNELQPSQSSEQAGVTGLSEPADCGAAGKTRPKILQNNACISRLRM